MEWPTSETSGVITKIKHVPHIEAANAQFAVAETRRFHEARPGVSAARRVSSTAYCIARYDEST